MCTVQFPSKNPTLLSAALLFTGKRYFLGIEASEQQSCSRSGRQHLFQEWTAAPVPKYRPLQCAGDIGESNQLKLAKLELPEKSIYFYVRISLNPCTTKLNISTIMAVIMVVVMAKVMVMAMVMAMAMAMVMAMAMAKAMAMVMAIN